MAASHDPNLEAIDPPGCGCTECLTGEYKPLDKASEDDIRALFAGEVRDHTEYHWRIEKVDGDFNGYHVIHPYGSTMHIARIAVPIPVDYFRFDGLTHREIETIRYDNGGFLD